MRFDEETLWPGYHFSNGLLTQAVKLDLSAANRDRAASEFIAVDVETTGMNAYDNRVMELGAVRFRDGKPVDSFSTLVNPRQWIPCDITRLTGITNTMVQDAPSEEKAWTEFAEFLGEAMNGETVIVAHNARFDLSFLEASFHRLGIPAKLAFMDTLSLSRKYMKGLRNYKLSTVGDVCGFRNKKAHRAVTDAEVCGLIFGRLMEQTRELFAAEAEAAREFDPDEEELLYCAVIQDVLGRGGHSTDWLRFYSSRSGKLSIRLFDPVFEIRKNKKGRYLILPEVTARELDLDTQACSASENKSGGLCRYFIQDPACLYVLEDYFCESFEKARQSKEKDFRENPKQEARLVNKASLQKSLSNEEVRSILESGILGRG